MQCMSVVGVYCRWGSLSLTQDHGNTIVWWRGQRKERLTREIEGGGHYACKSHRVPAQPTIRSLIIAKNRSCSFTKDECKWPTTTSTRQAFFKTMNSRMITETNREQGAQGIVVGTRYYRIGLYHRRIIGVP